MPILTNLTGYLYQLDGSTITTGNLIISLTQDFLSIEGNKITPFVVTLPLEADGAIDVDLFATENNVVNSIYTDPYPLGVIYSIEFDPSPADTSIALTRKNGYWKNLVSIPHVSDTTNNTIDIGSLLPATPTNPVTNPTYATLVDARFLTTLQKSVLVGGPDVLADDYHTHGVLSENTIELHSRVEPSNPPTDYGYIYMVSSGSSPAKTITVWCKFEDGAKFILGSRIV